MKTLRPRKKIVLALVLVALAAAAGVAVAAQTIVTDTDNVHLRIVKSQLDDGFDSGWHTHPGPAIVQVERGRFKITQAVVRRQRSQPVRPTLRPDVGRCTEVADGAGRGVRQQPCCPS
jgi:hypothetical protein